ncbi:hypothetical protein F4859DRAFT_514709 [Xylaria cf. heliscus]|nr:hypothetical protein F4859DRAFT_514709 [Xylaria cf. heliscus]
MFSRTKKAAETDDTKHPKPFAYRNRDNVRPSLQPQAYRARELLNCTVASFYEISDRELTLQQGQAKKNFIKLFTRQAKMPLKDLDDSNMSLYDTLKTMMGYLDEFFFFGSLITGPQSMIRRLVLTNSPPGMGHMLGRCEEQHDKKAAFPRFAIYLEKHPKGEHKNLPQFVATLAHEMSHAFLAAFTCQCSRCLRNDINAVGAEFSGHGPTFRGLNYAVLVCMAGWSAELDEIFRGRSEGTYIETWPLFEEKEMVEAAIESGSLKEMGMLPYIRNPSHRLLIRTSENSIVIDVERLRANVRRTSASISRVGTRPTSAGNQANKETLSTKARAPGVESATGSVNDRNNMDHEGQNKPVYYSDEDSDEDWVAKKSRSIYCTTSACKLPIHEGSKK